MHVRYNTSFRMSEASAEPTHPSQPAGPGVNTVSCLISRLRYVDTSSSNLLRQSGHDQQKNIKMADSDYDDDLDALASLLDDDADVNPYDEGQPFSAKGHSQNSQRQMPAVKTPVSSQSKSRSPVSSQIPSSVDESKSKQELIEELQRLREQMSQASQRAACGSSQGNRSAETRPRNETFSDALFAGPTPPASKKKQGKTKSSPDLAVIPTLTEDIDDDDLADLFDDEVTGESLDTSKTKERTPQKAESLFKKNNKRQAHTPICTAPATKKVSPYKCAICDKTFEKLEAMKIHEFKHKVVRGLDCDECGKSFTDKLELQAHLRTHSNERKSLASLGSGVKGSSGSGQQKNSIPHLGSNIGNASSKPKEENWDTEYFSKIRIINPLVSSATMRERMKERKMIRMSILRHYSRTGDMDSDWVTMGVIVRKMARADHKGKPYTMWILNDMSDLEETVALFLFGKVHDEHWKVSEGTVVGILNGTIMEKRDSGQKFENVQLQVDHPQKILVLGRSKDFGRCRGVKKDGQQCSQFVNMADCQYCAFHVQAQYKKVGAKRSELSSSYSGITPKSARMKIQKDNYIYGGKSVCAPSMSMGSKVTSQSKMTSHLKASKLSLKSLGVKGADALVDEARNSVLTLHGKGQKEEDMMVKVSGATKQFTDLLQAPTPGTQNLMRHMVTVEQTKKNVSTISAVDLLKQHKKEMAMKRGARAQSIGKPPPSSSSSSSSSLLTSSSRSGGYKQGVLVERTKQNVTPKPESLTPQLGRGWSDEDEDESSSSVTLFPRKTAASSGKASGALARQRALALIKQKGGIKKEDPNAVRSRLDERKKEAVKRRVEESWRKEEENPEDDSSGGTKAAKRRKTFLGQEIDMSQDEINKIMNVKSRHSGLIAEHEAELMERYFKEMEKKEGLENKLDSIKEMKRKVVSCKECCFTWFVPSDMCKREQHSLRWHEATQRFFRCKECKSRTITFDRIPNKACRCGSDRFERATMLKDRDGPKIGGETLLLRGIEEKYV